MRKIQLLCFSCTFLFLVSAQGENINVLTENMFPSKDSYVQFNTSTNIRGSETGITVKYNGTEFHDNSRWALFEYDFTPYLEVLSQIQSLEFCVRAKNFWPTLIDGVGASQEPATMEMVLQKITGFTFDESQANDVIKNNLIDAEKNLLEAVTVEELGRSTIDRDAPGMTNLDYSFSINVSNVLAGVNASNPKVIFSVKIAASGSMSSSFSLTSKEENGADYLQLRPHMRVGLNYTNPYNATSISTPIKDSYYQNTTSSDVYGNVDLLLLKGSTSPTMRNALIQFDFTDHLDAVTSSKMINLGLNVDFSGTAERPYYSFLNIYGLSNISFTESMVNTDTKTAYEGVKANEVFLSTRTIPMSTTSPTEILFELDKTKLSTLVSANPVVTFVVKSAQSPGGFFQIASKEHETRTKPFVQFIKTAVPTNLKNAEISQLSAYKDGNNIILVGANENVEVTIFNVAGQQLFSSNNLVSNIIPLFPSWGRVLLVSMKNADEIKCIKIIN